MGQSNAGAEPSAFYHKIAGAVTDYDIEAGDPLLGVANSNAFGDNGRQCRAIRCGGAGDLVVTRPDGTNVTLDFTAGEMQPVRAKALVASGSTATDVTVYW